VVRLNRKNILEITVEKISKQKVIKFVRRPHKFSNFVKNKSLAKI